MTDFDKEFESLGRYIAYRIDWTASAIHRGIFIDVNQIPCGYTPQKIMQLYQQVGVLITNSEMGSNVSSQPLTFEQFKAVEGQNRVA